MPETGRRIQTTSDIIRVLILLPERSPMFNIISILPIEKLNPKFILKLGNSNSDKKGSTGTHITDRAKGTRFERVKITGFHTGMIDEGQDTTTKDSEIKR